jgi:hypothetical protein
LTCGTIVHLFEKSKGHIVVCVTLEDRFGSRPPLPRISLLSVFEPNSNAPT